MVQLILHQVNHLVLASYLHFVDLNISLVSQALKRHGKKVASALGTTTKRRNDREENVVIEVRQVPHQKEAQNHDDEKKEAGSLGLTSMSALASGVRKQGPLLGKMVLAINIEGSNGVGGNVLQRPFNGSPTLSSTSSSSLSATTLASQLRKDYSVLHYFESLEEGNRPTLKITKCIKIPTTVTTIP